MPRRTSCTSLTLPFGRVRIALPFLVVFSLLPLEGGVEIDGLCVGWGPFALALPGPFGVRVPVLLVGVRVPGVVDVGVRVPVEVLVGLRVPVGVVVDPGVCTPVVVEVGVRVPVVVGVRVPVVEVGVRVPVVGPVVVGVRVPIVVGVRTPGVVVVVGVRVPVVVVVGIRVPVVVVVGVRVPVVVGVRDPLLAIGARVVVAPELGPGLDIVVVGLDTGADGLETGADGLDTGADGRDTGAEGRAAGADRTAGAGLAAGWLFLFWPSAPAWLPTARNQAKMRATEPILTALQRRDLVIFSSFLVVFCFALRPGCAGNYSTSLTFPFSKVTFMSL